MNWPWKRFIKSGHHQRAECLMRPGEWCRGIGNHPGRCALCPINERKAMQRDYQEVERESAIARGRIYDARPESIVNPDADYSIQPGDPEYDTVQRERRAFLAGFRLGARHPDSEGVDDEQVLDLGFDGGLI